MTETDLAELLKIMLNDLMGRADATPNVAMMYQAGVFTGLANALDQRSPHCAKTVPDAVKWYGEAVAYVATWRMTE